MTHHRPPEAIRGIPRPDPGPSGSEGGPESVQWKDLPENIRKGLASLAVQDWKYAVVVASESRFIRLGLRVLSLFDAYWVKSRQVEDFLEGRMTGAERDTYYQRAVKSLQELAGTVIELGVRARLVGDLQEDRRLLYRLAPTAWDRFWKDPESRAPRPRAQKNAAPEQTPSASVLPPDAPPAAAPVPLPEDGRT
jgi:hypothetical protein